MSIDQAESNRKKSGWVRHYCALATVVLVGIIVHLYVININRQAPFLIGQWTVYDNDDLQFIVNFAPDGSWTLMSCTATRTSVAGQGKWKVVNGELLLCEPTTWENALVRASQRQPMELFDEVKLWITGESWHHYRIVSKLGSTLVLDDGSLNTWHRRESE
ncbi:MAG: hypothetical protein JWM11_3262 [Planctomycetaceae bacterium]|nr:hypothetical protein [Planctomycetaceae bacterium]